MLQSKIAPRRVAAPSRPKRKKSSCSSRIHHSHLLQLAPLAYAVLVFHQHLGVIARTAGAVDVAQLAVNPSAIVQVSTYKRKKARTTTYHMAPPSHPTCACRPFDPRFTFVTLSPQVGALLTSALRHVPLLCPMSFRLANNAVSRSGTFRCPSAACLAYHFCNSFIPLENIGKIEPHLNLLTSTNQIFP